MGGTTPLLKWPSKKGKMSHAAQGACVLVLWLKGRDIGMHMGGGVTKGESLLLPRSEERIKDHRHRWCGAARRTHCSSPDSLVPVIIKCKAANDYWNPNSLGKNTELDPFYLAKYMIWKQTNAFFKTNPVQQFICKIPGVEQKPHKSFEAVDGIKGMLCLADVNR